jgi:hypothetical protein
MPCFRCPQHSRLNSYDANMVGLITQKAIHVLSSLLDGAGQFAQFLS